jgi:hypothetical protein
VTPADVCDAIVFCNTIAWGKVGHVNSLEEDFPEQRDEEVRHQLEALENQCQSALSDRAEED